MEKNEHLIFRDIPANGKNHYHSAILTSYSFDLVYFDSQLLSTLNQKRISSINLFVDQVQLSKSMDYVSNGYIHHLGRKYAVNGITTMGAFHPKINLLIGDNCALALLGSGNITVPGQGKNHELFTGFMFDEDIDKVEGGLYIMLQEIWQFIKRFANKTEDYTQRRVCSELQNNCVLLEDDGFLDSSELHGFYEIGNGMSASLLYNDETSGILQQAFRHIPAGEVNVITIVSPFFDEEGETLFSLSELCPNARIDVLLQEDCVLPPNKMKENSRIQFYDFDKTDRGGKSLSGNSQFDRRLHAKLFHFTTNDGEFCIVGSANATIAGVGTIKQRGNNEEFCVLYYSNKAHFLKELGLTHFKPISISVTKMERQSVAKSADAHFCVRLNSADYYSRLLVLHYRQISETKNLSLLVQNGTGDDAIYPIEIGTTGVSRIELTIKKGVTSCALINASGHFVSNRVFVNCVDDLETTNPSPENRKINKFIAKIENDGYCGLEVTEMICDLLRDVAQYCDDSEYQINDSLNKEHKVRGDLKTSEYNAEYDNQDFSETRALCGDNSSRLIDCIEDNIRLRVRSIEEELQDEEENGSSTESNNRGIVVSDAIPVTNKVVKELPSRINKLFQDYNHLLDARIKNLYRTEGIVTKEDFNFFALIMFHTTELCFLNHANYQLGVSTEDDNFENESVNPELCKFFDSLLNCMVNKGIDSLSNFSYLCLNKKPADIDDDYRGKAYRSIRYALLFANLLERNVPADIWHYRGWKVTLSLVNLINELGAPSSDDLVRELEPLSDKYDHEFRVEDIVALRETVVEYLQDKTAFPFREGYGIGIIPNQRPEWLKFQHP